MAQFLYKKVLIFGTLITRLSFLLLTFFRSRLLFILWKYLYTRFWCRNSQFPFYVWCFTNCSRIYL